MPSERKIKRIVIHCTDTAPEASVEHILSIFKAKGWQSPGYHRLITHTGDVVELLPYNEIANGARGYNADSIHVAYIGGRGNGGKPKDTRTLHQMEALNKLIHHLLWRFPSAELVGHNELNPGKACPCYNPKKSYEQWLKDILI